MFKAALTIFSILLFSCSTEDIQGLEKSGTITFKGGYIKGNNSVGKGEIPECSNETPTKIRIYMTGVQGFTRYAISEITIDNNNNIISSDLIEIPVGKYSVYDISLFASGNMPTHKMPDENAPGFNFGAFTNLTTPFDIEITPDQETLINGDLMCYTGPLDNLNGNLSGFNIKELQTLYYAIPLVHEVDEVCVTRIVIDIDGMRVYDNSDFYQGIVSTPILKDFELMRITSYNNSTILEVQEFTEYNTDNFIDDSDVIRFTELCNGTIPEEENAE